MIQITKKVAIPEGELSFSASRSSGPGGQNVNKVSSKVTLWFDVVSSPSLSDDEKRLILSRLATRVSNEGILQVTSQESRSQAANREAVILRFAELLRYALRIRPPRKKTRVSKAAKLRRLTEKKERSHLKQGRSKRFSAED